MLAESPKDQETAIAEKKDACRAHYAFSAIVEHLFRRWGGKVLDAVIVWDVIARYYSDYVTEVPILVEKNIIWIPARRGPFHSRCRCAQIYPK